MVINYRERKVTAVFTRVEGGRLGLFERNYLNVYRTNKDTRCGIRETSSNMKIADINSHEQRTNADTPAKRKLPAISAQQVSDLRTEHMFFEGDKIVPCAK